MSNRGPTAYQPNALPLGQTGSQVFVAASCLFLLLGGWVGVGVGEGVRWGEGGGGRVHDVYREWCDRAVF